MSSISPAAAFDSFNSDRRDRFFQSTTRYYCQRITTPVEQQRKMSSIRFRISLMLAAACLFIFTILMTHVGAPEHEVAVPVAAPKTIKKIANVVSTAKSVFSKIYETNMWGQDPDQAKFYSGPGSHDEGVVVPYVEAVREWVEREFKGKAPDALDLGCGDFNVGRQVRNLTGKYIGADVVPDMIEHNRKAFAEEDVDFEVVDIIDDDLPKADVVFIRQVLQHLNNAQIQKVLPKLKQFKWAVITEHLPATDDFTPNVDIDTGRVRFEVGSGTDLTADPFNLHYIKKEMLVEVASNGRIRTTAYQVS